MTWPVPGDFAEALEYLRGQGVVSDEEYDLLSERERKRAFKVAGVAQMDIVHDVLFALEHAIEEGDDLDDFKAAVAEALEAEWLGTDVDPGRRLETIFRTNLQHAYAAGRFEQATDPDVLEARPYWRFDAIVDGRETVVCGDADGTILPADHVWWRTHHPPLHFDCRSAITTLTPEEAEAEGITTDPTDKPPSKGFGSLPTEENEWQPDLDEYPEDVVNLYELHGAARGPGMALRPNDTTEPRTLSEALELARAEGIDWDDDEISWEVARAPLPDDLANYFRRARRVAPTEVITLEDLLRIDGRVPVHISPDTLLSDEAILWAIRHETIEIPLVLKRFEDLGGEMTAEELYSLIDATAGSAHNAACESSDDFIRARRRREEGDDDDG